jgi:3-deoxy-D-manno-octulosonic-acid transferase
VTLLRQGLVGPDPPKLGESRGGTLPLTAYRAVTTLLEPLAPALLRRRAEAGKEDPARLAERLGRPGAARPDGPLVWLHGVSVGETTSLLPLVEALRARRPELRLLVTCGTVTAAALLARRLPGGVVHQFAPVDAPGAVGRFLDHWRPGLAVFVESELWPNLLVAARRRGVRLALVSARMTQASAARWARWPGSARALLGAFDLILPQDEAAAARLAALGARLGPRLDLKRVGEPLPADPAELARLRAAMDGRKVVLAASTHPGDEALVAEAFRAAVADPAEALLVIAPRHPQRGPEIAASLGGELRSAGALPGDGIYVADTLGELGLFFRLADIVVMGGAFSPGIGGHNPLEPARIGRPILTGPLAHNAAHLYAGLFAEAAAIEAADAAALARHLRGLLDNPHIARRMGEAARAFAERQAAALDEAMALLDPLLPA